MILLITNAYGPEQGGIGVVVKEIAEQLKIKNVEHTILGRKPMCFRQLRDDWILTKTLVSLYTLVVGIRFILTKRNVVVYQHGIFLFQSLITLLRPKSWRAIIVPHGLLEPHRLNLSKRKKQLVLFLYERLNLNTADEVWACSAQELIGIASIVPNKSKLVVMSNGISTEILDYPYQIRNYQTRVWGFMSRIHPIKGLDLTIDAINQLECKFRERKVQFHIAGIDENGFRSLLENKVRELGLDDIVRFRGPLFAEEKMSFLDSLETFVFLSENENFGLVVLEALSRGNRMLISSSLPWSELAHMPSVRIVDRELSLIVEQMEKLLEDQEFNREEQFSASNTYVRENYDWNILSNNIIDRIESLRSHD